MTGIDWSRVNTRATSVSTEIVSFLEQLLRSGGLRPGDRLPPEREIAAQLGVSRASVRDAMHELALKGLTERRPGRGTVVLDTTSNVSPLLGALQEGERRFVEITDLRQVCEPSVAERAAERATSADLLRLDDTLRRSSPDLGVRAAVLLDEEFHSRIAEATQNPLLVALVDVMQGWLHDFRRSSHATRAGRAKSIEGHRRIHAAVQARDAQAAYAAMREHIADISALVADTERKPDG
ncbi:MAG TPA: FadR/GntR family transcriptional regulator [Streptosporangiales bacterium]